MIIEGEFHVHTSIQHTWGFLTNIKEVASCIRGCQKVEVLDDRNFAITISQKVGPVSATFETWIRFEDTQPCSHLTAVGKGKDTLMGSSFGFTNHVNLVCLAERETLLKYKADVKISGRLASVGQSLIKMIVKKEVDQAFIVMQSKIEEQMHEEF
jgi:uncharacterized protein